MTAHSGIDASLGIVDEVTYGTYVAPTRWLPFLTESLGLQQERNESAGLRSGQKYDRTDQWQTGKRRASGAISMELGNKGFGLLFKHCLGTIATTTDGAGKKHTATPGDLFGKSFTVQVGTPEATAGTVDPFSYMGCKVADWGISQALDGFPMLNLTVDAQDESTSQSLAAVSSPAETELLHWSGCVVNVGGSAFDALSFDFTQNNGLNVDRHHLRGARLKKEPVEAGKRQATGTITAEYEGLTAYNRFVNGTTATIVATWTAVSTYDTAKPFKLVLTLQNCRFDGTSPDVQGPGVVQQSLPFKVLDDGTNPAVQVDYFTSDVTP
jgi:hypothetical protein